MRRLMAIGVCMIMYLALLHAGPFGMEMGESLEQLEKKGLHLTPLDDSPGFFFAIPSQPFPEFDTIVIGLDPEEGLYWIKAFSKSIADSGDGIQTKKKFGEFQQSLSLAYGAGTFTDYPIEGTMWDKPENWMFSIALHERYYLVLWESTQGKPLRNNLGSLALIAQGSLDNTGYLVLEYTSLQYGRVLAKQQTAQK